jgi:HTH-type transcriptional regulator, transcriptional repressor of NAD biosynthesis genes
MNQRHGLVVGKFYPLHAGHQLLIRTAQQQCDELTVCILGSRVESIPLDVRKSWLEEEHPKARVVTGWDEAAMTIDDPELWSAHIHAIEAAVQRPVDAVFTSEAYGDELASRLGAEHISIDVGRTTVPTSGTALREDIAAGWHWLPPSVRAWFVRRVVIVGAESTGTTTLANDLADRFGAECVPEFGREYCYMRLGGLEPAWTTDEFMTIGKRQSEMEDEAARRAPLPLLVCDTDARATAVWHERYVGSRSATVETLAEGRTAALYILTGDDIPFEQDGWRDGEAHRKRMTDRFREVLHAQSSPWLEVRGSRADRLEETSRHVGLLLQRSWELAHPLG